MDKLEAVQDHINSLTGGMDGYTSSEQAFRRFDPTHPFGIAMLLAILLAGLLPPCKKLSARLAEKLRQPLGRSGSPLLWKSLLWIPILIVIVLAAAVEDLFLDGSTTRYAILLAIDTMVYSAVIIIQRAVWSALTPPDETSGDPSDDE